jgi:hypothetical protein
MKSTYAQNKALDHRYGGPDYTRPATVYVALFTSAPNVGGGGTEVSGGAYARAAITNNSTNFPAAVGGVKSNAAAVVFAQATAPWGTVTHAAMFDALTGGNMLDFNALDSPKTVATGDTPSLPVGSIRLTET